MIRSFRRLLLPALLLTTAIPALAQTAPGAAARPFSRADDPAEKLAGALRTLTGEPNNLEALLTAGTNALALGDPNAAVGFFGRAQGVAPREGRAKAGLGSALIQMEKPQDALRLFDEAVRLGVPEGSVARDRGLAYDLTGNPRRAQKDYQLALTEHPDDETARRRLALSQGISGDRAAAIATLDPLIRKRDIAGWRAQTFVLAMTGDAKGASDITHIMMPSQADALQPFLVRLPQLTQIQKARAVHFGEMPAQGRDYTPTELANVGTTPTYAATVAARPAPVTRPAPRPAAPATVQPAPTVTQPAPMPTPVQTAPTQVAQASDLAMPVPATAGHYDLPHDAAVRNKGHVRPPMRTVGTPVVHGDAAQVAAAQPKPAPVTTQAPPPVQTPAPAPVRTATVTPSPAPTSAPAPQPSSPAPVATAQPTPTPTVTPATTTETRIATVDIPGSQPAPAPTPAPAPKPVTPAPKPAPQVAQAPKQVVHVPAKPAVGKTVGTPVVHGDETRIAEATEKAKAKADAKKADEQKVASKSKTTTRTATSDDEDKPSAKSKKGTKLASADEDAKPTKGKKGAKASDDETDAKSGKSSRSAKAKTPEKAAPSKVYVQVAGGANVDDMDKAWTAIKKKAPDLVKGHSAQTTPYRATNRLVVGPFKSQAEAQAFVNKASGKGVSAFAFTSEKGQKFEKVGGGG